MKKRMDRTRTIDVAGRWEDLRERDTICGQLEDAQKGGMVCALRLWLPPTSPPQFQHHHSLNSTSSYLILA